MLTKSWYLKAALQGAMSLLPDPQRYNRVFQRYVTRSLELREPYFLEKWGQCERHLANYHRQTGTHEPGGFVALELGTGWFPITPVGLALSGARCVYTIDLEDLLAHERVVDTLRFYRELAARGRITLPAPDAEEKLRHALGRAHELDARSLLAEIGVVPLLTDARRIPLGAQSVDLLCSNNTLEHIPKGVLTEIFREFGRLVSERGVMSHFIDLADHYANFDPSITVYNFLRFSPRVWPLFNNSIQYQNRLRISDYRRIHEEAGWSLLDEESTRRPLDELRSVPLAKEFAGYSEQDLSVYASWTVARPADRVSRSVAAE